VGRVSFLLDTHAFLWALSEPQKLSSRVRSILEDPSNELHVSAVSLFEISTKVRIGKLDCPSSLLDNWAFVLSRLGAKHLPLNGAEAVKAGRWDMAHRDPFDRLLGAQAFENKFCLLSRDVTFRDFEGLSLLW
jgi:PIN domain nuclease of toxin-antitoxin system